jgi:hypothetical protein
MKIRPLLIPSQRNDSRIDCHAGGLVPIALAAAMLAGLLFASAPAWAMDEICAKCGREVGVSGDFVHYKADDSVAIAGVGDNAAAFREEIYGGNFTIPIAHLPAGKYTVSIGEVEVYATAKISFTVKNAGKVDGDEVAQVYFRHVNSAVPQPKLALCGFARVHLKRGESGKITVEVPAERLRYWDTQKKQYVVEPGEYEFLIGAASDDIRLKLPMTITGLTR